MINLLQNKKDLLSEYFINEKIDKNIYFEMEKILNEHEKLFTVCLN